MLSSLLNKITNFFGLKSPPKKRLSETDNTDRKRFKMSEPEKKGETWRQTTTHFQKDDIDLNTPPDQDLILRGYNFATSNINSTQFTFNNDVPSNTNKSNPFSFQAKPHSSFPKSHHVKKSTPFPNKISHHHKRIGCKRFDDKMCVRMEEKKHYQDMIEQSSRALGNFDNNVKKFLPPKIIAQEFLKGDGLFRRKDEAPLKQCKNRDDKLKEDSFIDLSLKLASYKLNDHFKGSYKTLNQPFYREHDASRDSTMNKVLYRDSISGSDSRLGLQDESGLKRPSYVRKESQSRNDFRNSCLQTILKSPYHSSSRPTSPLNSQPSTIILSDTSSPNSPSHPDTLPDFNSTSLSSFKDPRPPPLSSSHHRMLPSSSLPPSSSLFTQSKPPLSYKHVIPLSSTSSSSTPSLSNGWLDERYKRSVDMLAEVTRHTNNHYDNNNDILYYDDDVYQQSTTFLKSQQQQQNEIELHHIIDKKQPNSFSVSNDTTQHPTILSVYSKDIPQHQQQPVSSNNNNMSSLIQQRQHYQQQQKPFRNYHQQLKKNQPSIQKDKTHNARNNVVVINHRNRDARPNNTIDLTNVDENDDPQHHHHHHLPKGYHVDITHDDDDDDDDGTDCTVNFDPEESRRYLRTYENTVSTSPYCHKDFLHKIRDKGMWKERELRVRETEVEVDELRKKRSSHNTQESVINKMKNLMSITNRIEIPVKEDYIHIEDDEEDDEEEDDDDDDVMIEKVETNEFPELSREQQAEIDQVLSTPHSSKVVVEAFRYQLTHKDLSTLAGLNWLNDEVINFYMSLLVHRSEQDKRLPSIYAFNTFFYPKLLKGGQKSVRRWTKSTDIFKHSLILVPVHLGVHWCLAVMHIDRRQVRYYDSMGGGNRNMSTLLTYLVDEMKDKQQKDLDTSAWETIIVKDIPQQMNGSDCGMFACKFAEYLSRNANITFDQSHMPYFRRRMIYEIVTKQLL